MALYDDLDTKPRADKVDQVSGWGIKLLQTQLALKKNVASSKLITRKTILPQVVDLKTKTEHDIEPLKTTDITTKFKSKSIKLESDVDCADEYDPISPNDYEKLIKEKRDKERDKLRERDDKKKDDRDRKRRGSRFTEDSSLSSPIAKLSCFSGKPTSDDEDLFKNSPPRSSGVTIAPPRSLQEEQQPSVTINLDILKSNSAKTFSNKSNSVAAKIMAKYGFKDGQGLGKQEQGMSMALQVEKTSKRGGRIIHEKELLIPPQEPVITKQEPTITEIMKSPSKVVLLRNMVGPGDVDNDLEPEVKDECNEKYGEVIKVIIHEFPDAPHEEAVRIFVEFKRIESSIKAVVDLNGRFFGGRQVRAGFYNVERFQALLLTD